MTLQSKAGQPVPEVIFRTRRGEEWVDIDSRKIFNNRTVVLFSLPGAFTPTCSSTHLPGYNQLAHAFKQRGVDEIVCISVNDTFVMNEWAKDQESEHVTLIPDGNGEFTAKMGMLVDKRDLGFGERSWRYSMLVRNGIIEKMFIEPQVPGDPFEVSDAETMLNYISPGQIPSTMTVLSRIGCGKCAEAKHVLIEKDISFEEIIIGKDISVLSMKAMTGTTASPQAFVDGKLIGGLDAIQAYAAGYAG
ncbi:MAG: glutathione peroxidase [Kiritimatiellia bacterium]